MEITGYIDQYLIQGIFISILLMILVKWITKDKIKTDNSAQIIRWIIITYAILTIISFIITLLIGFSTEDTFINRMSGSFWWAYTSMLVGNSIASLLLLFNKFGKNIFIILLVGLLMNMGWIIESFVTHISSLHRDFNTENYNPFLPNSRELSIIINGLILGVICILLGNMTERKRVQKKSNNQQST